MALLNRDAERRIADAVALVETKTAGELVVVTTARSAAYEVPRGLFAIFAAALGGLELHRCLAPEVCDWAVLGTVPLFLLAYWVAGLSPILRLLVPRAIRVAAVNARARHAFTDFGVSETEERSGVLLLVSEMEHRVELLADRGVVARVSPELWKTGVDTVTKAIREGRAEAGLLRVIEELGALLAQHFPPRGDNPNELSNEVRRL